MNETVERYSASGSIQSGPYLFHSIGLPVFHDIAYLDGDIWFACDNSDSPIKAFNTSGALTDYIMNSVVPAAHGLCFESDQYLWASDTYSDQIYRIDLDPTGIAGGTAEERFGLTCSSNPFTGSVMISAGIISDDAVLEIFDVAGRCILSTPFSGEYGWAGFDDCGNSVPSGTYMVLVRDGVLTESLMITRL